MAEAFELSNNRERAILRSSQGLWASNWLAACPLTEQRWRMNDSVFRVALQHRLGIPIGMKLTSCKACGKSADIFGDHVTNCKKGRGVIAKHDAVVRALARAVSRAGLPNVVEKRFRGTKKRPGDIFVMNWDGETNVAFDIGVASVTRKDLVDMAAEEELTAGSTYEALKMNDYNNGSFILPPGYEYVPIIVESGGRWTKAGKEMMQRLAELMSFRWDESYGKALWRTATACSFALNNWIGRMILGRLVRG